MAQPTYDFLTSLPAADAKAFLALASSKDAKTLVSDSASAQKRLEATGRFIRAANALGLPPEHWLVQTDLKEDRLFLAAPLTALHRFAPHRKTLLPVVQALRDAGCPLWGPAFRTNARLPLSRCFLSPFAAKPEELAKRVLHGQDDPLLRRYLSLALADPDTPRAFLRSLQSELKGALARSSASLPGQISQGDADAVAACSVLVSCEAELLAAEGPKWKGAAPLLAAAKKRLALKLQPEPQGLQGLHRALPRERRERLRALGMLIGEFPNDAQLLLAAFEATPWLKDEPTLACRAFPGQRPLLAVALRFFSSPALSWLEAAGANPWLAAAQELTPDACHWAALNASSAPPLADFSVIARMLARGAWLSGAKKPAEHCVKRAAASAAALADLGYGLASSAVANARRLSSCVERAVIEQALPRPPAPARRARALSL